MQPARVSVKAAGGRDYEVVVAPGLLDRLGAEAAEAAPQVRRWVVVADETVAGLFAQRVLASLGAAGRAADVLTFPAGWWRWGGGSQVTWPASWPRRSCGGFR